MSRGVMTIGPEANLDFVREFLDPLDPARCEAAALRWESRGCQRQVSAFDLAGGEHTISS